MGLPKPIVLKKDTFYVYKTGLPFFDAARLIGVAHLFFGTASAEVEDKGAYWEVKGIFTKREMEQVLWALSNIPQVFEEREKIIKGRKSVERPLERKIFLMLEEVDVLQKLVNWYAEKNTILRASKCLSSMKV